MKINLLVLLVLGLGILTACGSTGPSPESGQNLAMQNGCIACHSVDDSTKIGPSWQGLYGSEVELTDGSEVTADDAYLRESIKDPNARIVAGYSRGTMPPNTLNEEEVDAIVAYIKSLK